MGLTDEAQKQRTLGIPGMSIASHCPACFLCYHLFTMNKALPFVVLGIAVLALAGFFAFRAKPPTGTPVDDAIETPNVPVRERAPEESVTPVASPGVQFATPKKSAHFESSTPAHGSTLAAPSVNVVIDFNFDLAAKSSISITSGGKEYGTGTTTIDANKLAMRRTMDFASPDGLYTVTYEACWPDGSCHDGQFQFAIDRTGASGSLDLRGKSAVSVDLTDLAFAPATIRISKGTNVTWKNSDAVEHYVNTDAHPSHTYYPAQNSKLLKTGETYSLVFNTPGAYPYHCSAHADSMLGTILVE